MKKTFYVEIFLLALLAVFLFLILDPFHIVMKMMLSGVVLASLTVVYLIKFLIIWREKKLDERDLSHRFYSSWVSYYITSVILFVGVFTESLHGMPDTWLIISLASLFVTKLGSLIYLHIYE